MASRLMELFVEITTKGDVDVARRLAAIEKTSAKTSKSTDKLSSSFGKLDSSTSSVGDGVSTLDERIASLGSSSSGASGGLGELASSIRQVRTVTTAVAGIPAVVAAIGGLAPVATAAAGATAQLATGLGQAAAGFGLIGGTALAGATAGLKAYSFAISRTVSDSREAYEATHELRMEQLEKQRQDILNTRASERFNQQLDESVIRLSKLEAAIGNKVFPIFTKELDYWNEILSDLQPQIAGTAGELAKIAAGFSEFIRTANKGHLLTSTFQFINASAIRAATALSNLGQAGLRVFNMLIPAAARLQTRIVAATAAIRDFVASEDGAMQLAKIFETLETRMNQVITAAKNLGLGLIDVFRALNQGGMVDNLMRGLVGLTEQFRKLVEFGGKGSQRITAFMQAAQPALRSLGRLAGEAARQFGILADSLIKAGQGGGKAGTVAQVIDSITKSLKPLRRLFQDTFISLGPVLADLIPEVAKFLSVFLGSSGPLKTFLSAATNLLKTFNKLPDPIKNAVANLVAFNAIMKGLTGIGIGTIAGSLGNLATNFLLLRGATNKITAALGAQGAARGAGLLGRLGALRLLFVGGGIVAGVVALGLAFRTAYNRSQTFKDAVDGVVGALGEKFKSAATGAKNAILDIFDLEEKPKDWGTKNANMYMSAWNQRVLSTKTGEGTPAEEAGTKIGNALAKAAIAATRQRMGESSKSGGLFGNLAKPGGFGNDFIDAVKKAFLAKGGWDAIKEALHRRLMNIFRSMSNDLPKFMRPGFNKLVGLTDQKTKEMKNKGSKNTEQLKKNVSQDADQARKNAAKSFEGAQKDVSSSTEKTKKNVTQDYGQMKKTVGIDSSDMKTSVTKNTGAMHASMVKNNTGMSKDTDSKFGSMKKTVGIDSTDMKTNVDKNTGIMRSTMVKENTTMDKDTDTKFHSIADNVKTKSEEAKTNQGKSWEAMKTAKGDDERDMAGNTDRTFSGIQETVMHESWDAKRSAENAWNALLDVVGGILSSLNLSPQGAASSDNPTERGHRNRFSGTRGQAKGGVIHQGSIGGKADGNNPRVVYGEANKEEYYIVPERRDNLPYLESAAQKMGFGLYPMAKGGQLSARLRRARMEEEERDRRRRGHRGERGRRFAYPARERRGRDRRAHGRAHGHDREAFGSGTPGGVATHNLDPSIQPRVEHIAADTGTYWNTYAGHGELGGSIEPFTSDFWGGSAVGTSVTPSQGYAVADDALNNYNANPGILYIIRQGQMWRNIWDAWRSWASDPHWDHTHVSWIPPGGEQTHGSGGVSIPNPLQAKFERLWDGQVDPITTGLTSKLSTGFTLKQAMAKKVVDLADEAREAIDAMIPDFIGGASPGGSAAGGYTGPMSGPGMDYMRRALDKYNLPSDWATSSAIWSIAQSESGTTPQKIMWEPNGPRFMAPWGIIVPNRYGVAPSSPDQERFAVGPRYIKDQYGTPENAWAFHTANNWYAKGGVHTPGKGGKGPRIQMPKPVEKAFRAVADTLNSFAGRSPIGVGDNGGVGTGKHVVAITNEAGPEAVVPKKKTPEGMHALRTANRWHGVPGFASGGVVTQGWNLVGGDGQLTVHGSGSGAFLRAAGLWSGTGVGFGPGGDVNAYWGGNRGGYTWSNGNMQVAPFLQGTVKEQTAWAHEIGHGLGLGHSSSGIMRPVVAAGTRPSAAEIATVKRLYAGDIDNKGDRDRVDPHEGRTPTRIPRGGGSSKGDWPPRGSHQTATGGTTSTKGDAKDARRIIGGVFGRGGQGGGQAGIAGGPQARGGQGGGSASAGGARAHRGGDPQLESMKSQLAMIQRILRSGLRVNDFGAKGEKQLFGAGHQAALGAMRSGPGQKVQAKNNHAHGIKAGIKNGRR